MEIAIKEEPEYLYDSSLEPDVILDDSDGSNISVSITGEMHEEGMMLPPYHLNSEGLRQCPKCKKFFKRLDSHMLLHEDIKAMDPSRPYTCQYCNRFFRSVSNLTVHMRTHTGFRPYVCDICKKGFTQSGNLMNHIRIHTGHRPFKCPTCDRAFTQSGNLGNHMRLHSQEKPFKCYMCDKAFTQSSNLNSHIKNNHKFLNGTFKV